jgi:hypothetical protein
MNDEQRRAKQDEIEKNLEAFLAVLPTLPANQKGKFAILRHREIVGFYDTVSDAIMAASKLYPDMIFSVQQVTDTAVNLGYYSHAVPLATA